MEDWCGVVERQLRFPGKRRGPPVETTRRVAEAEARTYAAELRARAPRCDYLVAALPIGRRAAA